MERGKGTANTIIATKVVKYNSTYSDDTKE